jgi:hypothetical protein
MNQDFVFGKNQHVALNHLRTDCEGHASPKNIYYFQTVFCLFTDKYSTLWTPNSESSDLNPFLRQYELREFYDDDTSPGSLEPPAGLH